MAVGRVHTQGVDTGADQRLGPRHRIRTDADGGAHAQPAVGIHVGEGGAGRHVGRLDGRDLLGLALRRLVSVDHPDSTLDRHGDGHPILGDRVHGGADDRCVQRDVA